MKKLRHRVLQLSLKPCHGGSCMEVNTVMSLLQKPEEKAILILALLMERWCLSERKEGEGYLTSLFQAASTRPFWTGPI